tara:strand:+ start:549 stop:980 length:432 start_codon:yes stop_codon:yes gene_type:complete
MFVSFTSIKNYSSAVGATILRPNRSNSNGQSAYTVFADSSRNPVIKVTFKVPGSRGNNFVACLLKLSGTKYRFRLYDAAGNRLNTITEEDSTPPSTVIENLVASINSNATFKKYIHVTFFKETTEAMSDSVSIEDGQRLRGGK